MLITDVARFIQIIFLDIVLSGDNAVIIGTLVASLVATQRTKALYLGMTLALVLRIILSLGVVYVLQIPAIKLIGGAALLYVAWGMFSDLRDDGSEDGSTRKKPTTFGAALVAVALADLSMSIDNVLGVAGAANGHWEALIFGLCLSIGIMAFAAGIVSKLIERFSWIAWIGLALIVFVAGKMFYEGWPELVAYIAAHTVWLNAHGMGFLTRI